MKKIVLIIFSCVLLACSILACSNQADSSEKDVYSEIEQKSDSDPRYEWIKAFIDGNSIKCAELATPWSVEGVDNIKLEQYIEWYKPLETIKLGKYEVEEINDKVRFTFEIVESDHELLCKGNYSFNVSIGAYSEVYWTNENIYEYSETYNDVVDLVRIFAAYCRDFPCDSKTLEEVFTGVYMCVHYCNTRWFDGDGKLSEYNVSDGAKSLFGLEEYSVPQSVAEYSEGVYSIKQGGIGLVPMDIVKVVTNDGFIEITVRFYEDTMKTVLSSDVKYILIITDNKYKYTFVEAFAVDK